MVFKKKHHGETTTLPWINKIDPDIKKIFIKERGILHIPDDGTNNWKVQV